MNRGNTVSWKRLLAMLTIPFLILNLELLSTLVQDDLLVLPDLLALGMPFKLSSHLGIKIAMSYGNWDRRKSYCTEEVM